jgi:hypothetical protein
MLELISTSKPRREKLINAYARIFKEQIDDELTEAYKQHEQAYGEQATIYLKFRDEWLAEKLSNEPTDVQERVESERMSGEDRKKEKLNLEWEDQDECGEEELVRRKEAYRVHS